MVKIVFILQVLINNGFTPDKEDYEFCAKVEDMSLPSQGYFGISAATGGLAGSTCSKLRQTVWGLAGLTSEGGLLLMLAITPIFDHDDVVDLLPFPNC